MVNITTLEMYSSYLKGISIQIATLLQRNKSLIISRNYNVIQLKVHEDFLRSFSNIDFDHIITLRKSIPEDRIKFNKIIGLNPIIPVIIKRRLSAIIYANREIYNNEEEIEKLRKTAITYEEYKFILHKFNSEISELILDGYVFNMGYGLSNIRIRKLKVTKARIDWGESNKKKKSIIASGGLPYKASYDSEGNFESDNGGEKWLIYFQKDFDYIWHWNKGSSFVPNKSYYRFNSTHYDNTKTGGKMGNENMLRKLERENPKALEKFYT